MKIERNSQGGVVMFINMTIFTSITHEERHILNPLLKDENTFVYVNTNKITKYREYFINEDNISAYPNLDQNYMEKINNRIEACISSPSNTQDSDDEPEKPYHFLEKRIKKSKVNLILQKIDLLLQVVKIDNKFSNYLGIGDTSNFGDGKYILINTIIVSKIINFKPNLIHTALRQFGFEICGRLANHNLQKIVVNTVYVKGWQLYHPKLYNLPSYKQLKSEDYYLLIREVKNILSNFNKGDLIDATLNPNTSIFAPFSNCTVY